MKTTFEQGSVEWATMKRDMAKLAFERAMGRFDIDAANIACAKQQYYEREIAVAMVKEAIVKYATLRTK